MNGERLIIGVDYGSKPSRTVHVIGAWDAERQRLTVVVPPDPAGTFRIQGSVKT